jgi:tetratricopeptide (TPR) repeat protein
MLLLLLTTLSSGAAHADEKDDRALDLFEKSEVAYDHGRFREAITLLQQSYAIKKEPVLLYNMGRAYEGLGDLRSAASAYESFLAAQPEAPDRGALESRIRTLRRQIDEREELERSAQRERAKSQPARRPSAIPWIVAGLGAAAVGSGAVLFAFGRSSHDRAVSEPTYVESARLQSHAESLTTAANVCWIAGGVALVAGVVWGIFDVSASKNAKTAASAPLGLSF